MTGTPHRLAANANQSFQGCILATTGFILDEAEAQALLDADDRNRLVVKPYLNGQDLNDEPRQGASRWAIDFADWSKDRAEQFRAPFEELEHGSPGKRERPFATVVPWTARISPAGPLSYGALWQRSVLALPIVDARNIYRCCASTSRVLRIPSRTAGT